MDWKLFGNTKLKSEAYQFLIDNGWEVSERTFYRHCEHGKLKYNREGVYTWRMLKKYAEVWLIRNTEDDEGETNHENLTAIKIREEIEKLRISNEKSKFNLEVERKKYIYIDDIERELAARALMLDNGFDFLFQSKALEIIGLVGGDLNKAGILKDFLINVKDEQLTKYANFTEFKLNLIGDVDEHN